MLTMLDAVYVDALDEKAIVGIQPKPAFLPLEPRMNSTEKSLRRPSDRLICLPTRRVLEPLGNSLYIWPEVVPLGGLLKCMPHSA